MKRLSISALVPGMVIAEDVYTFNNQLVFPKGLVLTDKAIARMEFYSIMYVRVEDELAAPEEAAFDPSYAERLRATPEFTRFQNEFEKDISDFKGAINDVIEGAPLNPDLLLRHTIDLITSSDSHLSVIDMLHNMRKYDDCTYVHCINVGLICNVFARWLNMTDDEINLATMSGLMHDVGKLKIPDDIINKPGKLTSQEYQAVKKHCQEGYKILANYDFLDKSVKSSALMHHERCDGSGYPYGLPADRIDTYAKMVAIADVYDAMTAARVYRGPLCPFIVISVFENEGLQKYDARFILTFLHNILNTYLLHRVRLSNGIEGDIIYINRDHLSMPTVKCGSQYIDLSHHPELYIEAMI